MNDIATGVYQLDNGFWGYRYTYMVNGKKKDVKKTKDESGNPLKSEKAAIKAREAALTRDKLLRRQKAEMPRVTFGEVYTIYCENGRSGKAYATIKKQDSLWRNHLEPRFSKRYIDEISVAEVNDYLTELYYTEGRAYRYVEGFLKMFYLIFGQAYSRDAINPFRYIFQALQNSFPPIRRLLLSPSVLRLMHWVCYSFSSYRLSCFVK